VPPTPGTTAWPPSRPSVPTSRATRVTFGGERAQLLDHGIQGVLEKQDFAANVDRDLFGKIARRRFAVCDLGDCCEHWAVRFDCHEVDVVGEILPGCRRLPGTSA